MLGQQLARGPVSLLSSHRTLVTFHMSPHSTLQRPFPINRSWPKSNQETLRREKMLLPDMQDYFQGGCALRTQAIQLSPLPPHSLSPLGWKQ